MQISCRENTDLQLIKAKCRILQMQNSEMQNAECRILQMQNSANAEFRVNAKIISPVLRLKPAFHA